MRITAAKLLDQAAAALGRWPWIPDVEDHYGLPRWLLLAVGSRETNLGVQYTQGTTGDHGHGHGVWQYDDRSHSIPVGFDTDPRAQAEQAARMLRDGIAGWNGNLAAALASYNAGAGAVRRAVNLGRHPDSVTTGHDYSEDVLARMAVLQRDLAAVPVQPAPVSADPFPEEIMLPIATNPNNGRYWVLTGPDGGVASFEADGSPSDVFFGNLIDHPEYGAGAGHPNGPAVNIEFWPQGQAGEGYVIYCDDRADDGLVRPYHFDAGTRK
jgi:hypothetical protein